MVILGNIIKTILDFTGKVSSEPDPEKEQKEMLVNLLKKARNTAFGRTFNFAKILQAENLYEAFSETIPYFDYDTIYNQWWKRQIEGEADITWPGFAKYYALSAGTTSLNNKRIPATNELLESIRKTSISQIISLTKFDLPADFFQKEILMLGGSTSMRANGLFEEGEISGISAKNLPAWFDMFYRPGRNIASISNWDEKVEAIAREAPNWDIGGMAGIPSWNELMLKKVIEYNNLNNIHEIWPNLRIFASGGVAFSPYRKTFETLIGKPLHFIDTYLASEGFIAFQSRPNDDMAMTLSTNSGLFFEFVPFEEFNLEENGSIKQGAKSLPLWQVEEQREYALVISSVGGAWRYLIGDTITFTDKNKAEIIITGRTMQYLNLVGSKLSVRQMNSAMKNLEEKFGILIPEFTVTAFNNNKDYTHHWYLGTEGTAENETLAEEIDKYLRSINKSYDNVRNHALKKVVVTKISPGLFYDWNEHKQKKGGQVKTPRVMKEEEFRQFQEFAEGKAINGRLVS